jgi:precorrin-6B methylase 2
MAHPTTFLPMAAGYAPLVGHHRHLLDDRVRTRAFLRAIAKVVRPGDVVADLGTGTGVLAIAARRAGARAVWAIDHDPIVRVAAAIAAANGVDGIAFVERHARDVELPVPIDVIVSECLGPFAVGGTMIRAVCELRARHLAPGGRVIPRSVALYVAPVSVPDVFEHVAVFDRRRYGVTWSAAHALATHNIYTTTIDPRALLAAPARVATIDLERDDFRGVVDGSAELATRRRGVVHGFAGWFTADLGGATLSTAPGKPATIWQQLFLPLPQPVTAQARTAIRFALRHTAEHVDWSGAIGDAEFRSSTRYSHPAAL